MNKKLAAKKGGQEEKYADDAEKNTAEFVGFPPYIRIFQSPRCFDAEEIGRPDLGHGISESDK